MPCLIFGDCAVRDFFLHFTVQDNRDTFQELRHHQPVIPDLDVLWYTERLLAVLVLELREGGTFLVEVAVSGVEVLDNLLERLRADFREPRQCLLEFGEFFAVTGVVGGSSGAEVFLFTASEEVVVEVAATAEVLGEQHLLILRGIEPELVRILYAHELM